MKLNYTAEKLLLSLCLCLFTCTHSLSFQQHYFSKHELCKLCLSESVFVMSTSVRAILKCEDIFGNTSLRGLFQSQESIYRLRLQLGLV